MPLETLKLEHAKQEKKTECHERLKLKGRMTKGESNMAISMMDLL